MEDSNTAFLTGLTILVFALVVAFSVQRCGEYNAHTLEVQKACLQSGHTPIECGVVKLQ